MAANRITFGGGFSDFRLTLERTGNRVVSVMSQFDDAVEATLARFESEPDWGVVATGVAAFQNPDKHPG